MDDARTRTKDPYLTHANLRSRGRRRVRRITTAHRLLTVIAILLFGLFVIGVIDGIRLPLSIVT